MGRMRALGGQWMYNKKYRSTEEDMASLLAVNRGAMQELMAEFPFDPMTILSLGPG